MYRQIFSGDNFIFRGLLLLLVSTYHFQASDLWSSEEKVTNHIKSIKCTKHKKSPLFPC